MAWLLSFGLTAPVMAMVEYTVPNPETPVCLTNVDDAFSKGYFIFIIVFFFFIPLLILVLLYRHIARHLVPPQGGLHGVGGCAANGGVTAANSQAVHAHLDAEHNGEEHHHHEQVWPASF